MAPGALRAAALVDSLIGTLTRLEGTAESRAPPAAGAADGAPLMPALTEQSTAPILVFDSDGCIRSCNGALGSAIQEPLSAG